MQNYQTPGVYVEELSKLPPSVAGVATAIPAFIGITEKCPEEKQGYPVKIVSLLDFESKFGGAKKLSVSQDGKLDGAQFVLYDSIRLFYDNGGGVCYVVSVAQYGNINKVEMSVSIVPEGLENPEEIEVAEEQEIPEDIEVTEEQETSEDIEVTEEQETPEGIEAAKEQGTPEIPVPSIGINAETFTKYLDNVAKVDEITMVLAPDAATCLNATSLGNVHKKLLEHCQNLKDRVAILDVKCNGGIDKDMEDFRKESGINGLSYGAAYYPDLQTSYSKSIDFLEMYKNPKVKELFKNDTSDITNLQKETTDEDTKSYLLKKLKAKEGYATLEQQMLAKASVIPPSGAIAGIYCANDARKGVWQAPANMSVSSVSDVAVRISDNEQMSINVDANSGKSVNAIRPFQGKGILVWGARTLDGFSNEWRYIPVRRLFNYVEESVQKSTAWAVFQPNDANTWTNVRCQIENFLSNLWRDGALAGATPEQAFYVNVGLNNTMDANDILEGRMIVEIGLAAVRPAEFIILQFSHKLQES